MPIIPTLVIIALPALIYVGVLAALHDRLHDWVLVGAAIVGVALIGAYIALWAVAKAFAGID